MDTTRRLPQFRVTLNSRCGRACFYCRPSGEAVPTASGVELALDDFLQVARSVRRHGIDSIKLTGGDPALYQPLVRTVEALKSDVGFAHVELISRHPRIGSLANGLAAAGLDQLNVSLDTIDPAKHKKICGIDDLANLLSAIQSCVSAGLTVKVNTVVMSGVNDGEIHGLIDRCAAMGVTTVKLLDLIDDLDDGEESFVSRLRGVDSLQSLYTPFDTITERLRETALSCVVRTQGGLGHPMAGYKLPSGIEVLVKDSRAGAWYGEICSGCAHYPCHDALMALRLTADLRLQYCLLRSDNAVDLSALVAARDETRLDRVVGTALGVYSLTAFTTQVRKRQTLVRITSGTREQPVLISN